MNKRYEKYKDSGVKWIGEIPIHWDLKRLKYEIDYQKGKNPRELTYNENGKVYLTMEYLRNNPKQTYFVEDYEKYVNVGENEILLLWDGSNAGEFIKSKEGILSSTMALLKIKNINVNYAWYLFKVIEKQLKESTIGMGVPHVNGDEFKYQNLILPPRSEQVAIANYLEKKTAKIDSMIDKKQKLIELLKEERTAIINQAVIKGIDPNVKLKSSGIEWLGDIPEHWEVKKVKHISKIQGRIGFKGYKSSDLVQHGEGAITLGASHISRDHKLDLSKPVYLNWDKYYESPEIMVKQGDIVFTQRGVYLGKVALIDKNYGEVTINPSLILLKEIVLNGGFLTFFLTSKYIRANIDIISSNTAIPMISQEQLANFTCVIPPDEEQKAILQYIILKVEIVDKTIKKVEKEINLLNEYRTALISEVVTGKIKVV